MILAATDEEIIIRHLDALYVCKTSDYNANETIVATTLNHFMKQRALTSFRKN